MGCRLPILLAICCLLAVWGGAPARAHGETLDNRPLWEAGFGIAAASFGDYAGGTRSRGAVVPFPMLVYRGPHLRVNGRSVRLMVYESPTFWTDVSVRGWIPVKSQDEPLRAGMPSLDATVMTGPRMNWRLWGNGDREVVAQLPVYGAWSVAPGPSMRSRGMAADPGIDFGLRHLGRGERGSVSVGISARVGSTGYNGYFYDVDPAYATATRPAFKSGPGLAWIGYSASTGMQLTERMRLSLGAQWQSLKGTAVAGSPLAGRHHTFNIGVLFSWMFWHSTATVSGRRVDGVVE